jgi:hypothetical protein
VGQARAQGAGWHARHVLASKPVESPPEERMRIPAVFQERRLCTRRAQAKEQEWQPMHRSILSAISIFMTNSSCADEKQFNPMGHLIASWILLGRNNEKYKKNWLMVLSYIPKNARPYFTPVKTIMPASIHLMVRAGTNFWHRAPKYMPAIPPSPKRMPRSQSGATDRWG